MVLGDADMHQVVDYCHTVDQCSLFVKSQYWRLLTTFLYFGPFSLDLLFHVYFLQRYARLLEESSGRSPAHFSWLLMYAMTSLVLLSPLVSMPFLGHPLSSTLVYIWSRRNPDTSLVLHGSVPKDEIMGVVIGHICWWRRIFERRPANEAVDGTNNDILAMGAPELAAEVL
ncbi:Derlin-2 like protein [Verticillium longisporum]|nr:Derlin-2 like protein [Verticillium longisporum]